jgi:hypothetical protein
MTRDVLYSRDYPGLVAYYTYDFDADTFDTPGSSSIEIQRITIEDSETDLYEWLSAGVITGLEEEIHEYENDKDDYNEYYYEAA